MIRIHLLVGFIALLFSNITLANTMEMVVNASDPSFKVKLPSNPTTGYTWKILNFDKKILAFGGETYVAKDHKLVGSGGMRIYTFNIIKRGNATPPETKIVFRYGQRWDDATSEDTEVKIRFKNTSAPTQNPISTKPEPNVKLPQAPAN